MDNEMDTQTTKPSKTPSNRKNTTGTLQQYINGKKLDDFFVEMVENILVESPDNPVKFIIDYLYRNYPNQANESSFGKTFGMRNNQGGGVVLTGIVESENAFEKTRKEIEQDNEDESSEEESEDDYNPLPEPPKRRARSIRRNSVCGESLSPGKTNMEPLPKYEKDNRTIAAIKGMLEKSVLFRHLQLEDKQMQDVIETMFPVSHTKGTKIIKQGDVGDNFYVVEEGNCEISIAETGAEEEKLILTTKPGDSFGELALMYNAPRAATVTAKTDVKLWALDRKCYKTILLEYTILRRNEYKAYLEKVKILEPLNEVEMLTLADSLVKKTFKQDEVIIRQNDLGEEFFIIIEGEVECTQQVNPHTPPVTVATLVKGCYFGEIALLTDRPRAATITVTSETVTCLTLERKTFSRLNGSLISVLKRNMALYRQFISDKI